MNTSKGQDTSGYGRRVFLAQASALSAAALFGLPRPAVAEPAPETTKIRLVNSPAICTALEVVLVEELLRLEGFSEVEYVKWSVNSASAMLATGQVDIAMDSAPSIAFALGEGKPILALAGVHSGCYELFASGSIQAVKELKGKRVAISGFGSGEHVLIASMVAYVGMDPRKDINWVIGGRDAMRLFADGKADAYMGFAPEPQQLRAKKIGHVIVNTTQDRPWSQYFCCMVTANREFVQKYPVATKRALRAFLKAADICANEPERVARFVVARGYAPSYDMALEVLKELPYRRWREASPEDTLRFHALRLHEVGMIKLSPQKLIAQGTDWRFLNELKKELKA